MTLENDLLWAESFGGGKHTRVNGHKVTRLRSTGTFIVEQLRDDGLPLISSGRHAETFQEALDLAGYPG